MAITANTKILTLDYWKPAYKLEVGDYVFDRKGNIVQVKLAQQYQGIRCYEVMVNDHLTVEGDANLALPTENVKYRNRLMTYKGKLQFRRPLRSITAEQMLGMPLIGKTNRKIFSVPTTNPLALPHQDLPVPAFVFGFWFFARRSNGTMAAAKGTTDFVVQKLKDHGYKVVMGSLINTGEREFSVTPTIESQLIPNIPKIITNNYLFSSPEQRQDLLSGIVCAKSRRYNKTNDRFRFSSRQYDTVRRVQLLAESLGGRSSILSDDYKKDFTVFFKIRTVIHPEQRSPKVKVHHGRRYVSKISPIPTQLCVHIETTGEDNTILVGEGFIPCL